MSILTSSVFNQVDNSIYSNAMTFLRAPLTQDPTKGDADVVILGLPFDMATSGRSGARMGPDAIRQASINLAWEGQRFPWDFKLAEQCYESDLVSKVHYTGSARYT